MLSLMYKRGNFEQEKDFNWHIALSEIFDPKEAKHHQLLTNHRTVVESDKNTKQDNHVYRGEFDSMRPLRFHCRLEAEVKVNNKVKNVIIVVWN